MIRVFGGRTSWSKKRDPASGFLVIDSSIAVISLLLRSRVKVTILHACTENPLGKITAGLIEELRWRRPRHSGRGPQTARLGNSRRGSP